VPSSRNRVAAPLPVKRRDRRGKQAKRAKAAQRVRAGSASPPCGKKVNAKKTTLAAFYTMPTPIDPVMADDNDVLEAAYRAFARITRPKSTCLH